MRVSATGISIVSVLALASAGALADEKTYDVSGFTGVSVSAGINAEIAVGGAYSVRAESTAEGLEKLDIRVRGGALEIRRKNMSFNFGRSAKVTVFVSMPEMNALEASSGSNANASGIAGDDFSIDASSGAHASAAGECGALSVDISSGAHVDAGDLKCKTASVDVSSGGNGTIFASESLVADASSGGNVRVLGEPKNVNIDRSSGGNVRIVK